MARKIDPAAPRATAQAKPDQGADDLAIIHPDRTLTIAGREVTLREYRFTEGLFVRARCKQLLADLHAQIKTGEMLTEDVLDVLATHSDLVLSLITESAGVEREWLEGLSLTDGDQMMMTWWAVCGPFFVRPIARRLGQELLLKTASVGLTSSPASPQPASVDPSSSTATPSGS